MSRHSGSDHDWDSLRNQIIGLGDDSHGKNFYSVFKQSRDALIRFRSVMEEIPDIIIILDEQDRILDLNKTALDIFNRTRKDLLTLDMKELKEIAYLELKEMGPERKIIFTDDRHQPPVYRELELRPVQLEQRSLAVLIGRDITHLVYTEQKLLRMNEDLEKRVQERTASIEEQMQVLKETQDQLVISEKMAVLGNLVAGVAHEINTPLGVGITASSALAAEAEDLLNHVSGNSLTERRFQDFLHFLKESSRLIQTNLERAGDMIQSFKQVAVDQSSELSRTINLRTYLQEVVHSLYPEWKRHNVTIEGELEEEILTVPGDWSQIITNLIVNSVIHGFRDLRGGGMILIRIYSENGYIVLDYRDNGCGLTKEQSERIFEPFYTTARGSGGTGLGMHIVYNLVTLKMKGSILCLPMEVPGASFHIRVPLQPAHTAGGLNISI